jgi:hypothetical protein
VVIPPQTSIDTPALIPWTKVSVAKHFSIVEQTYINDLNVQSVRNPKP